MSLSGQLARYDSFQQNQSPACAFNSTAGERVSAFNPSRWFKTVGIGWPSA